MKLIIAGDFCPKDRVAKLIEMGDFASIFDHVRNVIDKSDYSIVNLECPIVIGDAKPIDKIGPNLKTSEKGLEAIEWTGFKCVSLANNHFFDFGEKGVSDTLRVSKELGIDAVGGGKNIEEASAVLYKTIGNETLAIINCCEHEFSIATENQGGANPLNPVKQFYAIKEAIVKADHVIVIVHGGHEHWQLPSLRMVETYRFFIDAGADVVINHHQHCFSGYETYKGKPIFYGVGNFCFDRPNKRDSIWNQGYMVFLNFAGGISWEIIPYSQCDAEPDVVILDHDAYKTRIEELNSIIASKERLANETEKYYDSCSKQHSDIFEPIRNRYYLALKRKGRLPSLISKKRKMQANNYICCESHRDKLFWYLYH